MGVSKMRKGKNFFAYLLIVMLCIPSFVYGQNTREMNYAYDYWGRVIEDIPFFELYTTIDQGSMGEVKVSSMDDVTVSGDRIYIVDSVESRVNVFNPDLELITSIKVVRNAEGKIAVDEKTKKQIVLNAPEGVFVHEPEEEIYIADTGNQRIVVLNEKDFSLKKIINQPTNMVGQTVFKPSKIAVDRINRIYVVVQSGFEGIIELNQDGEFVRYFGVNKPKVNLLDYFWRQQASEEQKAKMQKVLAPSFNNIEIDDEGFIYATTQDSSAQDAVFRFNPKGENVLRENGFWKVRGDLNTDPTSTSVARISKFTDIALTDYGTYAVLDKEKGRIFIYNFDGELMNIFGGKGYMKGEFADPSSIAWLGEKLVITDKQMKAAYVYAPTEFGKLALSASEAYFNGEWDKATELLLNAVAINGNYEMAYSTIGKSYLMKEDYETAMYYFKLGDNQEYYSKAFNGYRSIWIKDHFGWIFATFVLVIGGVIFSEWRYYKKQKM